MRPFGYMDTSNDMLGTPAVLGKYNYVAYGPDFEMARSACASLCAEAIQKGHGCNFYQLWGHGMCDILNTCVPTTAAKSFQAEDSNGNNLYSFQRAFVYTFTSLPPPPPPPSITSELFNFDFDDGWRTIAPTPTWTGSQAAGFGSYRLITDELRFSNASLHGDNPYSLKMYQAEASPFGGRAMIRMTQLIPGVTYRFSYKFVSLTQDANHLSPFCLVLDVDTGSLLGITDANDDEEVCAATDCNFCHTGAQSVPAFYNQGRSGCCGGCNKKPMQEMMTLYYQWTQPASKQDAFLTFGYLSEVANTGMYIDDLYVVDYPWQQCSSACLGQTCEILTLQGKTCSDLADSGCSCHKCCSTDGLHATPSMPPPSKLPPPPPGDTRELLTLDRPLRGTRVAINFVDARDAWHAQHKMFAWPNNAQGTALEQPTRFKEWRETAFYGLIKGGCQSNGPGCLVHPMQFDNIGMLPNTLLDTTPGNGYIRVELWYPYEVSIASLLIQDTTGLQVQLGSCTYDCDVADGRSGWTYLYANRLVPPSSPPSPIIQSPPSPTRVKPWLLYNAGSMKHLTFQATDGEQVTMWENLLGNSSFDLVATYGTATATLDEYSLFSRLAVKFTGTTQLCTTSNVPTPTDHTLTVAVTFKDLGTPAMGQLIGQGHLNAWSLLKLPDNTSWFAPPPPTQPFSPLSPPEPPAPPRPPNSNSSSPPPLLPYTTPPSPASPPPSPYQTLSLATAETSGATLGTHTDASQLTASDVPFTYGKDYVAIARWTGSKKIVRIYSKTDDSIVLDSSGEVTHNVRIPDAELLEDARFGTRMCVGWSQAAVEHTGFFGLVGEIRIYDAAMETSDMLGLATEIIDTSSPPPPPAMPANERGNCCESADALFSEMYLRLIRDQMLGLRVPALFALGYAAECCTGAELAQSGILTSYGMCSGHKNNTNGSLSVCKLIATCVAVGCSPYEVQAPSPPHPPRQPIRSAIPAPPPAPGRPALAHNHRSSDPVARTPYAYFVGSTKNFRNDDFASIYRPPNSFSSLTGENTAWSAAFRQQGTATVGISFPLRPTSTSLISAWQIDAQTDAFGVPLTGVGAPGSITFGHHFVESVTDKNDLLNLRLYNPRFSSQEDEVNLQEDKFQDGLSGDSSIQHGVYYWPLEMCSQTCLLASANVVDWDGEDNLVLGVGCSGFILDIKKATVSGQNVETGARTTCKLETKQLEYVNELFLDSDFMPQTGRRVSFIRLHLDVTESVQASQLWAPPPPAYTVSEADSTVSDFLLNTGTGQPIELYSVRQTADVRCLSVRCTGYDFAWPFIGDSRPDGSTLVWSGVNSNWHDRKHSDRWGTSSFLRARTECKNANGALPEPRTLASLDAFWYNFVKEDLHGRYAQNPSGPGATRLWLGMHYNSSAQTWQFNSDNHPVPYSVEYSDGQGLLMHPETWAFKIAPNFFAGPTSASKTSGTEHWYSQFSTPANRPMSGTKFDSDCPYSVIQMIGNPTNDDEFFAVATVIQNVDSGCNEFILHVTGGLTGAWNVIITSDGKTSTSCTGTSSSNPKGTNLYVESNFGTDNNIKWSGKIYVSYNSKIGALLVNVPSNNKIFWVDIDTHTLDVFTYNIRTLAEGNEDTDAQYTNALTTPLQDWSTETKIWKEDASSWLKPNANSYHASRVWNVHQSSGEILYTAGSYGHVMHVKPCNSAAADRDVMWCRVQLTGVVQYGSFPYDLSATAYGAGGVYYYYEGDTSTEKYANGISMNSWYPRTSSNALGDAHPVGTGTTIDEFFIDNGFEYVSRCSMQEQKCAVATGQYNTGTTVPGLTAQASYTSESIPDDGKATTARWHGQFAIAVNPITGQVYIGTHKFPALYLIDSTTGRVHRLAATADHDERQGSSKTGFSGVAGGNHRMCGNCGGFRCRTSAEGGN